MPDANRRLLLVEDDSAVALVYRMRLEMDGYEVIHAADGEEALRLASAELPDLVLLDISLPGMDGNEILARIRASATLRRLPVIALTAHAMAGDREQAMAAGCDDYDTKPVDFARLMIKIENLLARASKP